MVSCTRFFLYKFLAPNTAQLYSVQETCMNLHENLMQETCSRNLCKFLAQVPWLCVTTISALVSLVRFAQLLLVGCFPHITELCLQLTAGSRPVNGDEHRVLRSQSCERALLTTGDFTFTFIEQTKRHDTRFENKHCILIKFFFLRRGANAIVC